MNLATIIKLSDPKLLLTLSLKLPRSQTMYVPLTVGGGHVLGKVLCPRDEIVGQVSHKR